MAPPPQLYKPVGFNDQDLIKEIMVLMEKIPTQAALDPKLARKNSIFASRIRRLTAGMKSVSALKKGSRK